MGNDSVTNYMKKAKLPSIKPIAKSHHVLFVTIRIIKTAQPTPIIAPNTGVKIASMPIGMKEINIGRIRYPKKYIDPAVKIAPKRKAWPTPMS